MNFRQVLERYVLIANKALAVDTIAGIEITISFSCLLLFFELVHREVRAETF